MRTWRDDARVRNDWNYGRALDIFQDKLMCVVYMFTRDVFHSHKIGRNLVFYLFFLSVVKKRLRDYFKNLRVVRSKSMAEKHYGWIFISIILLELCIGMLFSFKSLQTSGTIDRIINFNGNVYNIRFLLYAEFQKVYLCSRKIITHLNECH